jgi:hypothetical protein
LVASASRPELQEGARDMLVGLVAEEPRFYAAYAMTEGKAVWIQFAEETGCHTYLVPGVLADGSEGQTHR